MKTEEQRIAIAKACGWNIEITQHFKILRMPTAPTVGHCCGLHLSDDEVWRAGLIGDENGDFQFPDYLNDLNAMHEAAMRLCSNNGSGYFMYQVELKRIAGVYFPDAPADQRAEAFLRTLGLWTE